MAAPRWPRPALLRGVQGFRNPFWPKWFLVAGDVYRVSGDTSDARRVCECVGWRGLQTLSVTSTEFLCGPRTINLKKNFFFPKVPSEYGVFLCGK